jgi:hypothetical protein
VTPRIFVVDPAGLWSVFLWVSIVAWAIVAIAMIAAAITKRAVDDRVLMKIVLAAGAATVVALFVLLIASVAATDAMRQITGRAIDTIAAPRMLEPGMGYDSQSR